MSLDEYKKFHGLALAEILDSSVDIERFRSGNFQLERIAGSVNYLYMVNGDHCLYFKYSTKKDSPWRFTFTDEHLEGLKSVKKNSTSMNLVLICGFECIAVLNSTNLEKIIDLDTDSTQWISVKSFHNRSLRIAGSASKLDHTISKSKPFKGFLESI
jgi:hypothetical protein